jgi:hypothetical protein
MLQKERRAKNAGAALRGVGEGKVRRAPIAHVSLYFTVLRRACMVRQIPDAPLDGASQIKLRSETRF